MSFSKLNALLVLICSLLLFFRILWKKNTVSDTEATTFSIFYNNILYLFMIIVTSFYLLKTFGPTVNFTVSTGVAAGFVALLSTGS